LNRLSALVHRYLRHRRLRRRSQVKLHLGCGSNVFPGWTNVDMNRKGDLTVDFREGLPFRGESVRLIFSEHTLEHLYREHDAPHLLGECFRCLEPGGLMRIVVPDTAAFIAYYAGTLEPEAAADIQRSHARFHGTRMDAVNSGFRWKHQHLYMYDEETLRRLLEEIGFVDIQHREFRSSAVDEMSHVDDQRRRFGSLYMEARKPGRG
jgi:predicted SAM-dependent methyltransferase